MKIMYSKRVPLPSWENLNAEGKKILKNDLAETFVGKVGKLLGYDKKVKIHEEDDDCFRVFVLSVESEDIKALTEKTEASHE